MTKQQATGMRRSYQWWLAAALVTAMLAFIVRTLAAGAATAPRAGDIKKARREVAPAAGSDERAAPPPPGIIAGSGVVEPAERETKVAAEAPGRIAGIAVSEGVFVERGAVLVVLESGPERAALQAAEADLAAAAAELAKTLHGQRREDVQASVGEAEAARARAELSASVYQRTTRAAAGGAATADELDRAKRQAESDRQTWQVAEARRHAAATGSRVEDVQAARARVAAALARRDQARAQLDRLSVRAPIAGEVLQVKYRAGEYESPGAGEPLVILGDTRRLRARIDVDERDVGRLALGASAWVIADAFRERRFNGRVVEIGRRMGRKNVRTDDPTERIDTKILETVIELSAPGGLVPGLRVSGYIEPARGSG